MMHPGSARLASRPHSIAAVLALVLISACSFRNVQCGVTPQETATTTQAPAAGSGDSGSGTASGSGGTGAFQIVFLGDSLTAGYGLLSEQAFPALVQKKFAAEGYNEVETVNAGVSADTTAGARRRVEDALGPDTRILVVALGGNDAIRGLTVADTHDNFVAIIDAALARNTRVLLCGMEAPTNLGTDYRDAFRDIFLQLTREYKGRIHVLPFLLEGVAGVPTLNQSDGIHPNEAGARMVADLVYPKLRIMVDQIGG